MVALLAVLCCLCFAGWFLNLGVHKFRKVMTLSAEQMVSTSIAADL
jgi:hypothetical protein